MTVSFMKALSPAMMGIESGAMAVISFARSRVVVTDVWMWANPAMTGTRRLGWLRRSVSERGLR